MGEPQSYQNHTRIDPMHHLVIVPVLTINLGVAAGLWSYLHRERPSLAPWLIVLCFTFILMAVKTRLYALRNQDRLIALEERLRLTALLPPSEHAVIHRLTTAQLVALRFAPDDELPALARRTLTEGLVPKQIKQAIVTWRPDYQRI